MRLLIVEDDMALCGILVRALREDGHAVDAVHTATDARHEASSCDYDVIILDLGLPDGDGGLLCRELRDEGHGTPILMLTARDGLHDKVAGLDAGADDYVTKPFDLPELSGAVSGRSCGDPGPRDRAVLATGAVRLDPAARRVWSGEVMVPLTAREFALLEYFMRRPDDVITRSELLEHIWDANYDGLSNVVDVHIASLRRKLDAPGDELIETARGVGYRLVGGDT